MTRRLENKVVAITGGTSGIGEATAELFIAEGAKVVIAGRSENKGAEIVSRLGTNSAYCKTDVMKESDIKSMIDFTVEKFGRLDCLFNNAGGPDISTYDSVTPENFNYFMNLLLASVMFGIKHAAPVMIAQGSGCILNNSSIAAIRMGQGGYLYSAAKAAVTHVTKLAGVELGRHGIRVNAISPGAVATPIFWGGSQISNTMTDEQNTKKMERLKQNLTKATTLPRGGLDMDVAYAALYLASDEGSYITCHDLVVDGGRTSIFRESV